MIDQRLMGVSFRPEPWPGACGHGLRFGPCLGLGQGTSQIAKGQRLMAISLKPWPKILDIRGCAWGKPVGRGRPGKGLRPRHKSNRRRLMAISLEPWPKILGIRGCAWGKPVGRESPLNPGLRAAKSFYSHKNRAMTKPSSKCLPHRGKASGLDSEWLRCLSATLFFTF